MNFKVILVAVLAFAWLGGLHLIGQPADGIIRKDAPMNWSDYVMIASAIAFFIWLIIYAIREGRGRKK